MEFIVILLTILCSTSYSVAGIYKCDTLEQGLATVSYQDLPCAPGEVTTKILFYNEINLQSNLTKNKANPKSQPINTKKYKKKNNKKNVKKAKKHKKSRPKVLKISKKTKVTKKSLKTDNMLSKKKSWQEKDRISLQHECNKIESRLRFMKNKYNDNYTASDRHLAVKSLGEYQRMKQNICGVLGTT